jgi:hypothetical protein
MCGRITRERDMDHRMKRISREEAIQLGLKLYFTGDPCKRGHICERRVNRWDCVECHRFIAALRYDAKLLACDPERVRLRNRYFQPKHREPVPELVQVRQAEKAKKQTRRAAAEMENGPIS